MMIWPFIILYMSYNQWPFAHSISMQCKCGWYFFRWI